jgi:hypothetical protein
VWGEVSVIEDSELFSCNAEGLAWGRSGENWPIVRPSGETQGPAPSPDSSEEMVLGVSGEFMRLYLFDVSFVHIARRNVPSGDQVP